MIWSQAGAQGMLQIRASVKSERFRSHQERMLSVAAPIEEQGADGRLTAIQRSWKCALRAEGGRQPDGYPLYYPYNRAANRARMQEVGLMLRPTGSKRQLIRQPLPQPAEGAVDAGVAAPVAATPVRAPIEASAEW